MGENVKRTDISEDARIAAALWIAETAVHRIDEEEEYYQFCRETIDLCWEWYVNKSVDRESLYGRVSGDDESILCIVMDTQSESPELSDNYDIILGSTMYVVWQIFGYDKEACPEDLNEMTEDEFDNVIDGMLQDKIFEKSTFENLLHYLQENDNNGNKLAIKEKITEMIQYKSV